MIVEALELANSGDYEQNLELLIRRIEESKADLVLAPEVFLTGFDYEHFDRAAGFANQARSALEKLSNTKAIALTMIEQIDGKFYNSFKCFASGKLVHDQRKQELFVLGDETRYFEAGSADQTMFFELNGWKIGVLICFELRFPTLWHKLNGCDMVLVPAQWGKARADHLSILSNALAITNRAFVVVANSANDDMAKRSAIYSPWGEKAEHLIANIDKKEIKKAKRLIPYGV